MAAAFPDEIGFSVISGDFAGDLTFGEWHGTAARLARGLVARGVAQGDRVALVVAPAEGLRFVVAYAAAHMAGAVAVPVNIRLSPAELAGVLRHADPSAVVVSESLRQLVPDDLPSLRTVVPAQEWDDVLDDDASEFQVPTERDDLAEILYTSGTTGMPKGVAIRHSNAALVVSTKPDWNGQAWIHASPMFTFAGLTFVFQPMRMGMRTLYMPKFDTEAWAREVETRRPSIAFLVPAMVELLLAHAGIEKADLGSLNMVSVGAAPIAPATLLRLQKLIPNAAVTNSYSMTEAGTAYCILPQGELEKRPGSVGKPLPPAEIRVVGEDGTELPPEKVGEIVIKPAHSPRFYYKDPDATAELFRGDWLHTGDLGKFDADGYLYVVGRSKDIIIRGGFNVYASDVEAALYTHPDVQEAAVVGKPHAVLGEDIAAYVVVHEGSSVSPEELIVHCKEQLADYKVPRSVEIRTDLPRNATGKVLKRALVEEASAG
jgi:acyl-CoA synthetase (AMP-forming)/AMP-acid ligase II